VDSGATSHMSNQRELFDTFLNPGPTKFVEVANRAKAPVEGTGRIKLTTMNQAGQEVQLTLENVLFVPTLGEIYCP
jgi:hypothetical protein